MHKSTSRRIEQNRIVPQRIVDQEAVILLLRIGQITCYVSVKWLNTVTDMIAGNVAAEQITFRITEPIEASKDHVMFNLSHTAMTQKAKFR
jgi:hypothetical protein